MRHNGYSPEKKTISKKCSIVEININYRHSIIRIKINIHYNLTVCSFRVDNAASIKTLNNNSACAYIPFKYSEFIQYPCCLFVSHTL